MEKKRTAILNAASKFTETCKKETIFVTKNGKGLPERMAVIDIVRDLYVMMFPGYSGEASSTGTDSKSCMESHLNDLYDRLKEQVEVALLCVQGKEGEEACSEAEEICLAFFEQLPNIQILLLKDVQAGFDGDPAAKSREEIVLSYPGLFSVYVYRLAHVLYQANVPLIPRIMSEYAHGKTGIDIHPGAVIGEYFFIDHGTGVVIGETTKVGDHVKLYQGVTLGALSTRQGQQLASVKRHPTIEDHVTIYSNSTYWEGKL